jgi:hypothetical protein
LSSACHDFKHNGFNNNYHVNFKTPIAIRYNGIDLDYLDSSVLENFHIAETFDTMLKDENNLLCNLKAEEFRLVRRRMIECILATDMANHVKHLNSLKSKLESYNIRYGENVEHLLTNDVAKTFENQQIVLSWCVHTCDVSNPAKPIKVYDDWVSRVFMEFFTQGDEERNAGLTISPLCDRNTVDVVKSQLGFINFVVLPTFEILLNVIPEVNTYVDLVKHNLSVYEARVKEKETKI